MTMTCSKCAEFPRNQAFYKFPRRDLDSVFAFQNAKNDRRKDLPILPRSYNFALACVDAAKILVVKEIVASCDPHYLNFADGVGQTPLICAIRKGQCAMVKFLISANANVNIASLDGKTPLWWAVNSRQVRVVEILLERGAVAEPELDRRGQFLIQRAKKALTVEKQIQVYFSNTQLSVLESTVCSTRDIHNIILEYANLL